MQLNTILEYFAKYIEAELGIVYSSHNYFQLQNRLEEIAKLTGAADVEQLYNQSKSGIGGDFKQMILDVATNNETSFFRDPKIFKSVEKAVLNNFIGNNKLRIWSAASSSGQEAISLSILINEFNQKENANIQFSILGTDISERVLLRAKKATYSQLEVQRGLPAAYLIKYFRKDDNDLWTALPEVTRSIEFKKQNLIETFPFKEKFNLILCRNVLIYQSIEGKIDILKRITDMLTANGVLILGSGESLIGLSTDYEQQNIEGAIIYRKKSKAIAESA